jgi:hypothetical protein
MSAFHDAEKRAPYEKAPFDFLTFNMLGLSLVQINKFQLHLVLKLLFVFVGSSKMERFGIIVSLVPL